MIITLKDGSKREVQEGISVIDLAKEISEGLARVAQCGIVNGDVVDLRTALNEDCELEICTFDSQEGKNAVRHSVSHVLAAAVKRLFPEAKIAIGPAIANGFYYDFDVEKAFASEDLDKIEAEMKKIIKENPQIERFELPRNEALELMKDEPYKIELINDLPEDETISFYKIGDFTDLCCGPHVLSLKNIKAIKLIRTAGAYWKGDEKNKMLSRIYGTAFLKKADLDAHLEALEEAKKRDHKKLGKEMGLFTISEFAPGMPIFLPDGMILRNILEQYWYQEHTKEGYQFIKTPIMMSKELWELSGHWDHYKDNMYTSMVDDREFAIKPMNCPGALLVYNSTLHSYKDLPLRLGELGQVHRHEASGALNGLFRVRTFTQDDAHLFVTPDQLEEEVKKVLQLVDRIYSVFGLPYEIELSTRPESGYIGSEEIWDASEKALAQACVHAGKEYKVNPGDGAFYGPKLDIHIKDSLGRVWQCGTVQLDMNLPERFECKYVDADGTKKTPIMLHRVVYGSVERFIGILIEHFGGHFPLWLAPRQFVVIPVHHEKHVEYANKVCDALTALGMRATVDSRNEKLGYRVREAQLKKVTYQIVVGDGEQENNTITIRQSGKKDSVTLSLDEALAKFKAEVDNKTLFGK